MARGSIYTYTLADGSTRYEAVYRTSNGVQKKKRGFAGPREAQRFLNETMAAVDKGKVVATKDTFAGYIDRWLVEQRPRLEEGTWIDYRIHVEKRLKPYFGEKRLSDITAADVRQYVSELVAGTGPGARVPSRRMVEARKWAERLGTFTIADMADALDLTIVRARDIVEKLVSEGSIERNGRHAPRIGAGRRYALYAFSGPPRQAMRQEGVRPISVKTINNSLKVLRVALGHAQEDGLIAVNPAASTPGSRNRIKLPEEHREMDFLRLYEIPRYLDGCAPHYRPLADVLIATGLRIGEALALEWQHVEFDNGVLLVLGSRKRGRDGGDVLGSTKSDRYRSVEFGPRLKGILLDLRAQQTEHEVADAMREPVFVGPTGARLNRNDVSREDHKAALRAAGLRDSLRLHDLRHTAAASWLAAGHPLIYVQRQLGHASISTTEGHYGHLEKSFMRGAAKQAEEAIWGSGVAAASSVIERL